MTEKLIELLNKAIKVVSPVDAELKKACKELLQEQAKFDYLTDRTYWIVLERDKRKEN